MTGLSATQEYKFLSLVPLQILRFSFTYIFTFIYQRVQVEGNLQELVLSFHRVDLLRVGAGVGRLGEWGFLTHLEVFAT